MTGGARPPAWRVLVVDDAPDDRAELRRLLLLGSDRRYELVEADTAGEAVQAVHAAAGAAAYACVLLDHDLPDGTALDALAALTDPVGATACPIVVITGIAAPALGRALLRAGAQDYIAKDCLTPLVLTRAVENAVDRWALTRELRAREAALRASEHRLRLAQRAAGAGAWELCEATGAFVLSEEAEAMLQLGPAAGPGAGAPIPYARALAAVHPGDRARVARALAEALGVAPGDAAAPLRLELRLAAAADAPRWLSLQAERVPGPDGAAAGARLVGLVQDITERKLGEERLRRNAETFAALVRDSPFGVFVVDADLRLAQVSVGALRSLPDIERGLGRELAPLARHVWPAPFAAELVRRFRRTLETGEAYHAPTLIARRRDTGAEEAYEWRIERIELPDGRPGVACHFYDLTHHRRSEAALRASEERFRAVFEQSTGGIAQCDPTGRFLLVNDRFCEIAGRPREALLAMRVQDLAHPDDLLDNVEKYAALLEGHSAAILEERYVRPDGSHVWVHSSVSVTRDGAGRLASILSAVIDITDRKRAEEALREADRRKDAFLATLAHELRNPLAPLRTGLQLAKAAPDRAAAARTWDMMERQLAHMVRLVDDLLDVARVTRGQLVLSRARIALGDVLAHALEGSRPHVEAGGHTLSVRIPDEPIWVDGDLTRLAQVVTNLLNNAAKYTPDRGRIQLAAEVADGAAVVRVTDDGAGISREVLPRVFELFAQVEHTRDRARGGLGIGLSLARELVELHGGALEAASPGLGRGSTFTVRLPLAEAVAAAAVAVAAAGAARSAPGGAAAAGAGPVPARRRVLVVDDNVDAADTLAALLELHGHQVRTVYDGPSTLAAARELAPEVVILDIGLPGMSGHDVARALRAEPRVAGAVLVALTGWATDADRRRSREAGFDVHLTKPVGFEMIRHVLARPARRGAAAPRR